MSWQPPSKGLPPWTDKPIVPSEVLYAFDEPIIFIADIGLSRTLFIKFDESDSTSLYYAAAITDEQLTALRGNELSIRGALASANTSIVSLDSNFQVHQFWHEDVIEWDDKLLPARRVGLNSGTGLVWDSLDEARALFALNFQGASLGRSRMPLGALAALINKTHEAARRILVPPALARLKSASIDFEVAQPKFSSLIVALRHPLYRKKLRERLESEGAASELTTEIEANSETFVTNISELSESGKKGEISLAVAQERFASIEQIKSIVPTERNKLTELAITSNTEASRSLVVVTHEIGEKIVRARKSIESRPVVDLGRIIQVNDKRSTVVYQSVRGKEVTFALETSVFQKMEAEGLLKLGNRIRAVGRLERRERRDLLNLTELPQTSPGSIVQ